MSGAIELTLVLRPPAGAAHVAARLLAGNFDAAETRAGDIGASAEDVAAVIAFAAAHHLKVLKTNPLSRSIHVAGMAADIEKAFGIEPGRVEGRTYRGPMSLPEQLIAVLGLDHTPVARPLVG